MQGRREFLEHIREAAEIPSHADRLEAILLVFLDHHNDAELTDVCSNAMLGGKKSEHDRAKGVKTRWDGS